MYPAIEDILTLGIMYYVLRITYYTLRCTLYVVHCTLYVVRCTLYIVRCTLYIVRCTLYVVRCTLYVVRCTLYVVRCTLQMRSKLANFNYYAVLMFERQCNHSVLVLLVNFIVVPAKLAAARLKKGTAQWFRLVNSVRIFYQLVLVQ